MRALQNITVLALGTLAAIYLINPTAGFLELLPDNFPLVGNLDEATATLILASAFRYFGFDPTHIFRRPEETDTVESTARRQQTPR